MRIMRLGPLFASTFLLFAFAVHAQQVLTTATASRDPQSVALLQRSLAALVGTNTVKDVTLSGSVQRIAGSDDETGTATLKATSSKQGRVDLIVPSGQRSDVIDLSNGSLSGSWCDPDGAWHSMVDHNLFTDPTWFFPTFLIARALSTTTYEVTAADAETKDGISVEHFAVFEQANQFDTTKLTESLSRIDIYLNSSTMVPVSIAFNIHADSNVLVNIPTVIKFSNFQNTQGIAVPYHIQKYINNGLALDVTVTGVQVNSGISATDFQVQ